MDKASSAQVQEYLGGMDYPATKEDLVSHARSQGAPQHIVDAIEKLPRESFDTARDVSQAFGEMHEME